MFEGEKFLTIGVSEQIPMELQLFMWNAIAKMPAPKDYLQVFELKAENGLQVIHHTAEEPAFEMNYVLTTVTKTVSAKVYVIDDYYADEDKHRATMLLAEEY